MYRVLLAFLLLAGCTQSPAQKAQADVDFLINNHGSTQELCDAYGHIADAYRDEHNAKQWNDAKVYQRIHCRAAASGT